MPAQARVLIVARDDSRTGALAEGLDRLGWTSIVVRGAFAAIGALADQGIEAALIDSAGLAETDDPSALARQLRAAAAPRRLAVIGLGGGRGEPSAFDVVMIPPAHPAQTALRLEQLVRASVAEEELDLRRETFAERGRALDPPQPPGHPFRVLTIGDPAPRFLALANALDAAGAETVAAFTSFTAFDYLHERPFDAVVLWAGARAEEALAITAGLRRNTRLFHIPAVLVSPRGGEMGGSDVYHRGVSDVAEADEPADMVARRVLELARAYRRAAAIRAALERARISGLMDPVTGLFTRELFAAHLARLAVACRSRRRALTVCVLKVAEREEIEVARRAGWLDRALPQIGGMVGRLVRAEDTAARLSPETFALALPATPRLQGRAAAERIAAVIGCTAFEAGSGRRPFIVDFDIGVAELDPGEVAGRALERAARELAPARTG